MRVLWSANPCRAVRGSVQINGRTSLADIQRWLSEQSGETVKPTGRIKKNLSPIVRETSEGRTAELAWWGYLVDGMPAKFPSINTRSERLQDRPRVMKNRALAAVPSRELIDAAISAGREMTELVSARPR